MCIRRFATVISCAILMSGCYHASKKPDAAEVIKPMSFNDNWIFHVEGADTTMVSLPHIPRIEPLVVNDQWQGKHIYVKTFTSESSRAYKTILHFEGVMHEATVFVNGMEVKKNKGGYLPFSVDITNYLTEGENELKVAVSNVDSPVIPPGKPLEGLDFNFYGGIYRDVWLITKNEIYITDPFVEDDKEAGWLLHFDEVDENQAKGQLSIEIRNESPKDSKIELKGVFKLGNKRYSFGDKTTVNSGTEQVLSIPVEIPSPQLWSTTSPKLYDLSLDVFSDGRLMDRLEDKVGVRKIELTEQGFFLNGEKQFLRGTNRHQEYPYVGYAISNNANFRDALKIKNAGFDFVRLSHYPHDEAFLDACDELGILVMNAIPGWQHYQEGEFVENSFQDIREMVRRDRNHPSVVFWEVSLNESGMTEKYMEEANRILREELPFDDTYSAGWIDHPSYDLYIPARQHGKPPHYFNNHKDGKRNVFIAEYGDWEYYAHNAGFNQTAFADLSEEERNSRQLRAHGERRLLQQAMNFQEAANSNRKGIATIGHANWLMFDYNRGYAIDLEASGISDIFRIPKFAYYFYKSQRPPDEDIDHPLVEDGPMVKTANYWTEDSPTDVRIFSNCEQVALYLNDSLIAIKSPTVDLFSDHLGYPPFEFELGKFQAGKLKAVGFIEGKEVAFDSLYTPGKPELVQVKIDTISGMKKEKGDVFLVHAKVTDSQGIMIPDYSEMVTFQLEGEGELIGENPVKAEAGIASILFRGNPNEVSIKSRLLEKMKHID